MATILNLADMEPVKKGPLPRVMARPVRAVPDKDLHDRLNDLLATAVDNIGQSGFTATLAELCEAASGYDSTFIAAYFQDHPPVELFDNLASDLCDTTIAPYLEFAHLLDPFHNLFRRGISDRVVTLAQCAPDDFLESEYYRSFYDTTGLFDETTIFVTFGTDAAVAVSLGSRQCGFTLSDEGYGRLISLLPVLRALCHRHWVRLDPYSVAHKGRMGLHLEQSFERFGSSVLSEREAEIVRLVLKGHSSKSIARLLGNSPETVRVHRKRIYAKLNIVSQGQLFSIFLQALSCTPPNASEDPLHYLGHNLNSMR